MQFDYSTNTEDLQFWTASELYVNGYLKRTCRGPFKFRYIQETKREQ